ncbi:MAG: hypothetical protein IKF41_02110 [Alphaproteobacteria bacterium]|nr:hypothetical protein [Alphaproteobacteria bacterium]
MQELANSLIDSGVQCWTCPVFDSLFAIISNTAAAAYQRLCIFSIVIFCVLFAFYALNVVWNNIKNGGKDSLFDKTLRPILIKSLIALSLLSMGLIVPRFISMITFEPVAIMTLQYSKAMLPSDYVVPVYQNAINLGDNGFFNPALRDTIIQILETSVANFQVYIKIGIAIIDEAFSLKALLGIGSLIKHIIICFIGIFLTYNFAKLFIKYSFCFMDVIFAMAIFAFFFPLSVIFFIFRDANEAPGWMKSLGSNLGGGQIKKLINAIASVASTILTYTVIMLIIRGFLNTNGVDADSIRNSTEALFDFDLENSSAMQITFAGAIVLVYVINYIANQIPKVTEKILSVFNVKQENALSKEMGENVFQLTQIMATKAKDLAKTIINPETADKEKRDK